MKGSAPSKKDGICQEGEELSSGILVAVPSTPSPEPQTPVSLHMTVACSALPVLEPRVSGWEQNVVHWLFKNVPVSTDNSPLFLADRIPTDFHSHILCKCLFVALMLWADEPGVELKTLTPPRGLLLLRYPSGISAAVCGIRASPFHTSTLPTSLDVASSINSWL